jgi:hypothetical protein
MKVSKLSRAAGTCTVQQHLHYYIQVKLGLIYPRRYVITLLTLNVFDLDAAENFLLEP